MKRVIFLTLTMYVTLLMAGYSLLTLFYYFVQGGLSDPFFHISEPFIITLMYGVFGSFCFMHSCESMMFVRVVIISLILFFLMISYFATREEGLFRSVKRKVFTLFFVFLILSVFVSLFLPLFSKVHSKIMFKEYASSQLFEKSVYIDTNADFEKQIIDGCVQVDNKIFPYNEVSFCSGATINNYRYCLVREKEIKHKKVFKYFNGEHSDTYIVFQDLEQSQNGLYETLLSEPLYYVHQYSVVDDLIYMHSGNGSFLIDKVSGKLLYRSFGDFYIDSESEKSWKEKERIVSIFKEFCKDD